MDHFETYADAGNACLAVEEAMEREEACIKARIKERAEEIEGRMVADPESWADALVDFAYWPASSAMFQKEPQRELVMAMRALMTGDHAEFGRVCVGQIKDRFPAAALARAVKEITKETAREHAEMRLDP